MTIRSKLLISYGLQTLVVLAVGIASVWTILKWNRAADDLELMRSQSQQMELLRAGMNRQVNFGLDFLESSESKQPDLELVEKQVRVLLAELKQNAQTSGEIDHLVDLEETQFELSWRLLGIYESLGDSADFPDRTEARSRLREIAEEVGHVVAVIGQFYRTRVDRRVEAAEQAGFYAIVVIVGAIGLALSQLLGLLVVSHRWLVRPIDKVNQATARISNGDFETKVGISSNDEWGKLGQSIDEMALSLRTLSRQVVVRERLATLGEVASYTAHNIQNPLAGIRAAAQVSRDSLDSDDDDVRSTLGSIIESVDRLSLWIRRFLGFARPLDLQLTSVNMNELLLISCESIRRAFSKRDFRVNHDFREDIPSIMVDELLLEQTLVSLMSNAIEAKCTELTIATSVERVGSENWISISIVDDGNGIAPEIKDRLFRPFVTNKAGGTGLGLAQAKKVIDLHSGQLRLESNGDSGTTVHIRLLILNNAGGAR